MPLSFKWLAPYPVNMLPYSGLFHGNSIPELNHNQVKLQVFIPTVPCSNMELWKAGNKSHANLDGVDCNNNGDTLLKSTGYERRRNKSKFTPVQFSVYNSCSIRKAAKIIKHLFPTCNILSSPLSCRAEGKEVWKHVSPDLRTAFSSYYWIHDQSSHMLRWILDHPTVRVLALSCLCLCNTI